MMFHREFHIGLEFSGRNGHWRCTDIGNRVIVAIRIDRPTVQGVVLDTGECWSRTMSGEQAEREGWLAGPPYMVEEVVFDENDIQSCKPFKKPEPTDTEF